VETGDEEATVLALGDRLRCFAIKVLATIVAFNQIEQFNHSSTENKRQTISITLYFIDTTIEQWKLSDSWPSLRRKNKMIYVSLHSIKRDLLYGVELLYGDNIR